MGYESCLEALRMTSSNDMSTLTWVFMADFMEKERITVFIKLAVTRVIDCVSWNANTASTVTRVFFVSESFVLIWPWQDQRYSTGHLLFCLSSIPSSEELFCFLFFGILLALSIVTTNTTGVGLWAKLDWWTFLFWEFESSVEKNTACWSWVIDGSAQEIVLEFLILHFLKLT